MPTIALGYLLSESWFAYARYQEGFRSGGTSIRGRTDDPDIENFDADEVTFFETGMRGQIPALNITGLSFSLSYAEWEDIQSDLIDRSGLPFTTNVGTGNIYSANMALTSRPWQGFEFEAKAFFSRSDTIPIDTAVLGEEGEFPNIPELGLTLTGRQTLFERANSSLTIGADYTFVGESTLAIQGELERDQGSLSVTDAWLDYRLGRLGLSFTIRNLLNASANRFAFGNPFTVFDRPQATPLRPRTYSIAISREF